MDIESLTCAHCEDPLPSSRPKNLKYCSPLCRGRAWEAANMEIVQERSRQRYVANRDAVLEQVRERARLERERDPELVRAKTRERMNRWRAANPDRALEQGRNQYAANAEALREQARRRYESDPERCREQSRRWRKANPGLMNEQKRRRRALKKGATIIDVINLDVLFERDGHRCHICKKSVLRLEASVDHLVPLSKGGDHSWANVSLAHRNCNSKRGVDRIPAQLRLVG